MPKLSANGIRIDYNIEGKGEPLVMLIGFSARRTSWSLQTRVFRRYFRVITLDNRGAGKTAAPGGPCTVRQMAEDAAGLMEALGISKAHVLGVSMGGMIAQELAINHPDRVQRLVLASTYARRDASGGFAGDLVRALGGEAGYTDDDIRHIPTGRLVGTLYSQSFNSRALRILLAPLSRVRVLMGGTAGIVSQLDAVLAHDTADRLHTITAPTLVMAGTRDRLIAPSSSEAIARSIPDARLVKVEGGSHAFFLEMPGRFNREVLDFLAA